MTNDDLREITQRHLPDGYGHCEHCPQPWPCDASRLLDHVLSLVTELQDVYSKLAVVKQNAFNLAESRDKTVKHFTAPEGESREGD